LILSEGTSKTFLYFLKVIQFVDSSKVLSKERSGGESIKEIILSTLNLDKISDD